MPQEIQTEPLVVLILRTSGLEIRYSDDDAALTQRAHELLARISFELKELDAALRRPAPEKIFQVVAADPGDIELTAATRRLLDGLGPENDTVQQLLGMAEFFGGNLPASDLRELPAKRLGYLLSAGLVRRARQGGYELNVRVDREQKNGRLVDWAPSE